MRIDKSRRAKQILLGIHEERQKGGRPRKNWTETFKNDLRGLEISWKRAEKLEMDKAEWRGRVAAVQT